MLWPHTRTRSRKVGMMGRELDDRFGQSGNAGAEVNLRVFGDGQQLPSVDLSVGGSAQVSLDVAGELRLRIRYQPIDTSNGNNDFDLGAAPLQELPGEAPVSVDPNLSAESIN
jgi:hypothetical protein